MRLILVGGFLGAGKTTLLAEVAKRLTHKGISAGLITNDQVPHLVDTALLTRTGVPVKEVAGNCFCCNFDGFHDAVLSLAENGADCIVAEPVGSCTDLSATIIQPLKAKFPAYALAPLSVLVDPQRVRAVLKEKHSLLHADAAYILHLQLEEADRIVLNKCDTLSDSERDGIVSFLKSEFPQSRVLTISARSGDGIDAWLDGVLDDAPSGTKIATVDYDRYAHGEAVLGWLNAVVSLRWIGGLASEWDRFAADLLDELQRQLREKQREIGHIKILVECASGCLAAHITGLDDIPNVRRDGAVDNLNVALTVNARVQISPREIESLFRDALKTTSYARVAPTITAFHCIQPGRPVPTYRFDFVVA